MIGFCKMLGAIAGLTSLVLWLGPASEVRHPPGVRCEDEPIQVDGPARSLGQFQGYDLTAVASYTISARVLHTKHYWADGNDLVPYDVALGWGAMSDQAVLDQLKISQSNRFYFYQWSHEPPRPVEELATHSSNHHVIAANGEVAASVRHLRRGQFVKMRGSLVNVSRPDGFHWNTSLSRTDRGNGACEVFFVETISVSDEPG